MNTGSCGGVCAVVVVAGWYQTRFAELGLVPAALHAQPELQGHVLIAGDKIKPAADGLLATKVSEWSSANGKKCGGPAKQSPCCR